MYSLVLNGEPIDVSIVSLMAKCHLFQTKPGLLGEPYRVESRVSSDSLRVFVGAIAGAAAEISDANIRDLSQLCDEFKFIEFATTVGNWQAEHPLIDPVIRRELDLVRAALEERLESQTRMSLTLQDKHEKLRDTVARQGDELAEAHRRNEALGGRLQQLEEETRLLRESSDGLKGQLARTEARQQSAVARVQDAIAAAGSKVNEDLGMSNETLRN
jgi:hypothetical protein